MSRFQGQRIEGPCGLTSCRPAAGATEGGGSLRTRPFSHFAAGAALACQPHIWPSFCCFSHSLTGVKYSVIGDETP